jgi:NADH-quinone oxidoreductase subunit I
MDHDYEISSFDRFSDHIYDLDKLLKPASYYAKIRPIQYAEEEVARLEKEAKKAAAKVAKQV